MNIKNYFKLLSVIVFVFSVIITNPAFAKTSNDTTIDNPDLIEQGTYINKSGKEVHSPAHTKSGTAPAGATAKCADGTYSFSQSHRGTCSRHGGVKTWL